MRKKCFRDVKVVAKWTPRLVLGWFLYHTDSKIIRHDSYKKDSINDQSLNKNIRRDACDRHRAIPDTSQVALRPSSRDSRCIASCAVTVIARFAMHRKLRCDRHRAICDAPQVALPPSSRDSRCIASCAATVIARFATHCKLRCDRRRATRDAKMSPTKINR